jgi:hypothetical protein
MLCDRIIQSLQEENAQLKGRLILQMAELAAIKLQIKAVSGLQGAEFIKGKGHL